MNKTYWNSETIKNFREAMVLMFGDNAKPYFSVNP